jgi:hypothetical protein
MAKISFPHGVVALCLLLALILLAARGAETPQASLTSHLRAVPSHGLPGGRGVEPGVAQGEKPVEQVRKNIQVLKGLPSSQLFPLMNFVSASLGVRCDHCHVNTGGDNWVWESDEKPSKLAARRMMQMVLELNKNNLTYFRGSGVTCYTCHLGRLQPVRLPPMPLPEVKPEQSGAGNSQKAAERLPTADAVLRKYVESVGGSAAVAKLKTRVIKGTREASQGRSWPLEVSMKGADKFLSVLTIPQSDVIYQGFNDTIGWYKNSRGQHLLSADELASLKETAELYDVVKLKEPFPALTVAGTESIGGREVYVLETKPAAATTESFYFDTQTGLLLRELTLTHTALLPIPEQIDFEDYRDVDGVKLPFTIRISNIDPWFSSTRKLVEVKHGLPLDDALFQPPAAQK